MLPADLLDTVNSALTRALVGRSVLELAHLSPATAALRFTGPEHEVRFAEQIELTGCGTTRPAVVGTGAAAELLLPLIGAEVTGAAVDGDGALTLTFAWLSTLTARAGWQVRSDAGLMVVSETGGAVSLSLPPSGPMPADVPR